VLLFILSLFGFSGALATRLLDPLITSIAADFTTSVGVVALLSSAFALPFGLSQLFLGPAGDAFGKVVVIRPPQPSWPCACSRRRSPPI
jgi:MFS family permease